MTKPTDAELIAFIDKEIDGSERGLFEVLPEHLSMVKAIRDRLASLNPSCRRPKDDKQHAAWLADKIHALGDYAKEAAAMLNRWPDVTPTSGEWLTGHWHLASLTPDNAQTTKPATFPCPKCNGWGWVKSVNMTVASKCNSCQGSGAVPEERMPNND